MMRSIPLLQRVFFLGGVAAVSSFICGCVPKVDPPPDFDPKSMVQDPLQPEDAKVVLNDVGRTWLYGDAFGQTLLAVGSIIVFPPAAGVMLGYEILEQSGVEFPQTEEIFGKEDADAVRASFKAVYSTPGKIAGKVTGHGYVSEKDAKEILAPHFERFRKKKSVADYLDACFEDCEITHDDRNEQ